MVKLLSKSGELVDQEVKLLTAHTMVNTREAGIADFLKIPISEPFDYLPSFDELAKWIDAVAEETQFRYVIIALNTWARNATIFDMRVSSQINFDFETVKLNPPCRKTTNKRRPVIRLTENLAS